MCQVFKNYTCQGIIQFVFSMCKETNIQKRKKNGSTKCQVQIDKTCTNQLAGVDLGFSRGGDFQKFCRPFFEFDQIDFPSSPEALKRPQKLISQNKICHQKLISQNNTTPERTKLGLKPPAIRLRGCYFTASPSLKLLILRTGDIMVKKLKNEQLSRIDLQL